MKSGRVEGAGDGSERAGKTAIDIFAASFSLLNQHKVLPATVRNIGVESIIRCDDG
jgi:hypothetical protein